MIQLKTPEEIEKVAAAGRLLEHVHDELAAAIRPGVTTARLDARAEELVREGGGTPTFLDYQGFPASICSSVNDLVVHGIPGPLQLCPGDLVSIDIGVTLDDWIADCARSYVVGESGVNPAANPLAARLIDTAYRSLEAGIDKARPGVPMGDLSYAIQQVVEHAGFAVIRTLVGHGVGRSLHEEPPVPNHGRPGAMPLLEEGMVIAIEPMITTGTHEIVEDPDDGWSIYTADGSLSAHVEHTVAITADGPRVLTRSG